MWPWTHLAFGYLLVSMGWRLRGQRISGLVAAAVALGTQLPDLIDKPLAWYFGVLPAGRSLAHSAFTAAAVSLVVLAVATHSGHRDAGVAFTVGYVSHLLGDALPKLPGGDYESVAFLLWPVLPLPEYGGADPVLENLGAVAAAPMAYLLASPARVAVVAAVVLVWSADGFPGLAGIGRYLTSRVRGSSD